MSDLKSKKLIVHLTPQMHEDIANYAKRLGISMGEYVRRALTKSIDLERVDVRAPIISVEKIDEY